MFCVDEQEQDRAELWKSMLIIAKTGYVDGYCLAPPEFKISEVGNYVLCAGRDDGLLIFVNPKSSDNRKSFDQKKFIKLSRRYVNIVHIVPIEEADPETTLLLGSFSQTC